jgi:glycosyltransferase involved in cell wall biosynthesis
MQDNAIYQRCLNDPVLSRRIRLSGKVNQVDLSRFFASSDLYVVSSRMETANVSMLQALACGIPVVSTLCGASETLLDPSISILVPVGNPEALAKGILEMAGRISDYPAEKLRGFVEENYSLKAVGSKMAAIYTGALNAGNVNERVRKATG